MKKSFSNTFFSRLAIDSALLVAFFVLPWWLFSIIAVVLLILIPSFVEIILFGALFDSLYGGNSFSFSGHIFTIISIAIYLIFILVSKRLLVFGRDRV